MSLYHELKRRNVFRVAIAYLAAAWLLIEVAGTLFPVFGVPDWGVRFVVIVLALGFLPALIISWAYELTPEGLKREKDVVRDASIIHITAKRLDGITIGLIVVALVFILADRLWLSPRLAVQSAAPVEIVTDIVQTSEPDSSESQYPPNSVAVLPFVNMSSDPDQEYFSDGLAEEILIVLSRVPGLVVTSRTSSFAYKGTSLNITQIADQLRVRYIIEGSVRRTGNQLRIVANLIDTANGQQIWSEQFDGEADDVFAIQGRTANAILLALNIHFDEAQAPLSVVSGTDNVLAHDLFLKGRYYFNQRDLHSAVGLFQQATEVDSNYGEAYAFLALAQSLGHGQTDIPRAQAAANRAVELAPQSPTTLIAQGQIATKIFNSEEADRALRRAVQLEPRNGLALYLLGTVQFDLGRYEEARKLGQRASDVDPAVAIYRNKLAQYCMALGLTNEGLANFDSANELGESNPVNQYVWRILAGESTGAQMIMEDPGLRAGPYLKPYIPYLQALVLINNGKLMEARDLIDDAQEVPETGTNKYGNSGEIVIITSVYLGDIEAANRLMERMLEYGYNFSHLRSFLPYLKDFPIERTRFNELREEMGLPGYVSR